MSHLLTEKEVAGRLAVSLALVRRWRLRGCGPRYIKIGALVRYRPEDVESFIKSRPSGGTPERVLAPKENEGAKR